MPRITLAQALFSQGFGVRRACDGLVRAGRVQVNGQPADDPAQPVDTEGLVLHVEGRDWPWYDKALVLLHKPAGYECSLKPSAWPGVLTLLPAPLRQRGVQPVGRLDQDTTGVLLLTDDGPLLHRLTSPKHHVPKVYQVRCARPVEDAQIARLLAGVVLNDDPRPVRAEACVATGSHGLALTLTQGKYHQVKRMVAAVGNHCEALHRSAFGPVTLAAATGTLPAGLSAGTSDGMPDAALAPGAWRFLDATERDALVAAGRARSAGAG